MRLTFAEDTFVVVVYEATEQIDWVLDPPGPSCTRPKAQAAYAVIRNAQEAIAMGSQIILSKLDIRYNIN